MTTAQARKHQVPLDKPEGGKKSIKEAHAEALEAWLETILRNMIPFKDRQLAASDKRYVRNFLRAKKIVLEKVPDSMDYVLLQKRKEIARFKFQIRPVIEEPTTHEPATQSAISQN